MESNLQSIIAVIPARGGSKRIPNKNIIPLAGKPLIVWTIEAALQSKCFDEVMVSTDDLKIARIAEDAGANVPYIRPKYLAKDTSKTYDVLKYTLNYYQKKFGKNYKYLTVLQPTSPLRASKDIKNVLKLIRQKKADAIISVCQVEQSSVLSNYLPDNLSMKKFIDKKYIGARSQSLPVSYKINGSIFIYKVDKLLKIGTSPFFNSKTYAYIMPQERSIDIDTQIDFELAQLLIKKIYKDR